MDPVAAYDRIAPVFSRLAKQRKAYLDRIDQLVLSAILPGSRSMLDVGSGDGTRARRIAQTRGIAELYCSSQVGQCRATAPRTPQFGPCAPKNSTRFKPSLTSSRVSGMSSATFSPRAPESTCSVSSPVCRLPQGRIFVDVNHRYNARHYGALRTALRFLRDRLSWRRDRMAMWWLLGMSAKHHAQPGATSLPTRNFALSPVPPACASKTRSSSTTPPENDADGAGKEISFTSCGGPPRKLPEQSARQRSRWPPAASRRLR